MFNLSLSILSGLLTGLSFNSACFSFLIWFSFVPLLLVLYRANKPGGYFFVAGLAHYMVVIFWLGFVSYLGLFLLIFYLALYWLFFGYIGRFLITRRAAILALPCFWVILEFARENFPGVGFGWAILGFSQYKNLFLIQIADIFGAKFISFLIMTINMIIVRGLGRKKIIIRDLIYGSLLITVSLGYSAYKLNNSEPQDNFTISVVQPNIAQELKWDSGADEFIIERLNNLGKRAEGEHLLVYPEASWPFLLDVSDVSVRFEDFAVQIDKDVLIGVVIKEGGKFYNAAILMNREGGFRGIYRKIKLVPFGEYVPLRSLFGAIEVLSAMGDISGGDDFYIFNYKDKRFATLICFEDTFPLLVSKFAKRSDFLINITNDAWFGGEPQASQHISIMTFRAIENRISIVRSANTGISGYVDFLGSIHKFKNKNREVFTEGVELFKLPLNSKRSIYNRLGEFFALICLVPLVWVTAKPPRR